MGRRLRILLTGGIYHEYNRLSRGEHVFPDEGETDRFEALLAATKKRGNFQMLPWCENQGAFTTSTSRSRVGSSGGRQYGGLRMRTSGREFTGWCRKS